MRVEFLRRIMEDGTKSSIVVNLDCVCSYSESTVEGIKGCMKNKTVLTLSNGLVMVVDKTFEAFQKIMSQDRK